MSPIIIFILFNLINIFHIIKASNSNCPKEKPFLMLESGECRQNSSNCLNSKECSINNKIVKTQWLNNFIMFGELSYTYIYFGAYSNGDMIVETASYPFIPKRIFYGLKKNGRPFFRNKTNNKETPFYSININNINNMTTEATAAIIKLSGEDNQGKEYFMAVSKRSGNAELFDFDKDVVYIKTVSFFTNQSDVCSIFHTFIPLTNSISDS